jgi:hypothetical protein
MYQRFRTRQIYTQTLLLNFQQLAQLSSKLTIWGHSPFDICILRTQIWLVVDFVDTSDAQLSTCLIDGVWGEVRCNDRDEQLSNSLSRIASCLFNSEPLNNPKRGRMSEGQR